MAKKSDSYPTDNALKAVFAGWFDPCELSGNELRAFDGLGSSWGDRSFVNPPYSNPKPWVEHAIRESRKGKTVVLLLKMDTSTEWFKMLQEAGALFLWVNGRLRYGTGKPAPFPSMLAVLCENVKSEKYENGVNAQ